MKLFNIFVLLVLASTARGFAAENNELTADQSRVLEAVRVSALQYTQSLPDFICTQITHREVTDQVGFGTSFNGASSSRGQSGVASAPRGAGGIDDLIEERLTFFDEMEHYEVIAVNGKKAAAGQDHMQFGGAISAGEFGSALQNLFNPRALAEFSWDKVANVNGRRVYIFKFQVPSQNGTIVIHRETDQKILVASTGRLFVDGETLQVVRITSELELPTDFPIKMATVSVDYKPVAIAGKTYNLPNRSQVRMKDNSRLYVNQIEFRDYHKFAVESTIHYDSEGAPPKQ
ncbi:MAG: hypothetical protein WA354_13365 [Terracidiphilus sp.]